MAEGFGPGEVRLGETFARIESHHAVALELHRLGEQTDALLQATRPITHILPGLLADLQPYGRLVPDLTFALGAVASAFREPRVPVEGAVERAGLVLDDALRAVVGAAARTQRYRASLVAALLGRAAAAYRDAVTSGDLASYHEAYALTHRAVSVCRELPGAGADELNELLGALTSPLPPLVLPTAGTFESAAEAVRTALVGRFGALAELGLSPADELRRLGSILRSALRAYESGSAPLAARLAAEAFVGRYAPVRTQVARLVPDLEAELASLLGTQIRVAINDRMAVEEVSAAVRRAEDLIARASDALG